MTPAKLTETLEGTAAVIRIHADDNVGISLRPLEPGERVDTVDQEHKFALESIEADTLVQEFGRPKREIAIWKRGVTL